MVMKRKKPAKKPKVYRRTDRMRSSLEEKVSVFLFTNRVQNRYETEKFPYVVLEHRKYLPDFILRNGIVIEVKGYFPATDRKKMLRIKDQYPSLDIRFIFGNKLNKINKQSKTTYEDWSQKYGFPCCDIKEVEKVVEWYNEPVKEFPIPLSDVFNGDRKLPKGWKPSKRPRRAAIIPERDITSLLGRDKADSK